MRRASAPGDMWFEGDPVVLPHSSSLSTRSPGKPAKRVLITSRKPWFSGQPQKAPIQPKFHFTLAEEFEMLVADDQEIMHNVLREVAIDEKFTRLVADLPADIRHKIIRQDVTDIASKHMSDQEMDIQYVDNILSAELLPPVPKPTNRGHFAMIKKLQKLSGKGFGTCKAALYKHNVDFDAA